jgi:hypothetical protein
VELEGRGRHPIYRRVLFACVCVLPVLALLNVFGQDETTSHASAAAATLTLEAPKTLRGGLLWQARITVVAHRTIKHPEFVLTPGWWEQMTQNSVTPNPPSESSSNGRVVLSYAPMSPGQRLIVWIDFQVNPINVGRRETNVRLTDGPSAIAEIDRHITVLP